MKTVKQAQADLRLRCSADSASRIQAEDDDNYPAGERDLHPGPMRLSAKIADREAARWAWLERSARRLLRLDPKLLGKQRRAELEKHLDRHDWIESDFKKINEELRQFADHLSRL
jgi:hypothetical protein